MKFLIIISVAITPLILSSCSSGKKAYEQGDYYAAVLKAVNRLRNNPDHKKSSETLKKSYPLAVSTFEQDAKNAMDANDRYKFKKSLQAYEAINRLYHEIQTAPAARKIIPKPKNYTSKAAALKSQAAEESYAIGLALMKSRSREHAKQAFFHFEDVNRFVPGYKNVAAKTEEALFIATLKVIVEQIPVPAIYSLSADFFQDKVEGYLHSRYRDNRFVRFYTQREAEAEKLPYVDQYLRLQFDDFTVGETHMERNIETVTRDSVKIGSLTLEDGSQQDILGSVSAKITISRREVRSRGLFSMQAIDAHSQAVLTHEKFSGEFVWFSQWGSFNGDERALTEETLKLCRVREVPPPRPQVLFTEFTKPIYNQLTAAVQRFYRRY